MKLINKSLKKKFLVLLFIILNFHSNIQADDIRDFQLEEISLFESALLFFSKQQIKERETYFDSNKYILATIKSKKFTKYQDLQIAYKTNDNNFTILGLTGIIDKNYGSCLKKINEISIEFKNLFPNTHYEKLLEYDHQVDKSGETKVSDMFWEFNSGDQIVLACYKWNSKYGKEKGYVDEMRISLRSKEYNDFLLYEAYN